MGGKCDRERGLAPGADLLGGAEGHRGRGVQADPAVAVLTIVEREELAGEGAGALAAAEPRGGPDGISGS